MLRRVFAWIILVGFVFIFIDIVFIGFMRPLFATLYVILVLAFLFMKQNNRNNE